MRQWSANKGTAPSGGIHHQPKASFSATLTIRRFQPELVRYEYGVSALFGLFVLQAQIIVDGAGRFHLIHGVEVNTRRT